MRALLVLVAAASIVLAAGCRKESTVTGKEGQKLTLKQPSEVKITRGETADVKISITRKDLADPVKVDFRNLPEGVSVTDADKTITGDGATYTLKASDSAALVENHQAVVEASAGGISVSQPFKVTVKSKG